MCMEICPMSLAHQNTNKVLFIVYQIMRMEQMVIHATDQGAGNGHSSEWPGGA